jgi:hypothetical protein
LGVGAPNRCKNGEATQCGIALCESLGLFRIYPFKVHSGVKVWSICDIEAEPSAGDNRFESWKLKSIAAVGKIENRDERAALLDACVLNHGNADAIDFQNEKRASIALIKPEINYPYIARGEFSDPDDIDQSSDAWIYCQKEYPHKPYVNWTSPYGKEHYSHLVAHEAYEWLRKEPTKPHQLFDNMNLINPDYINWVLLGNMKNRRNVWVIVHIHRLKAPVNYFMRHYFADASGRSANWPYSIQEAAIAKRAESPQMDLPFTTSDTFQTKTRGSMAMAS